jgi:nicotinate dehydrogenase subunit B
MASDAREQVDPTLLSSWIRIRPDNTVTVWVGVTDFGQGTVSTNFRQIVAEELRLPFAAIAEVVTGDTGETPDGGVAAGVMHRSSQVRASKVGLLPDSPFGRHALNLQKVAAYAYAELLERASAALGTPVEDLTASDGVVSDGRGSCLSYADLVRDAPLQTRIELAGVLDGFGLGVLGTPAVVPPSQYRVIGTDCPNPRITEIVAGTTTWVTSVKLPGMLHGRMVHPRTMGSTLVSIGRLDGDRYPTAQVVVRDNLVGVVAEDEWEAVQAAEALAETTVWSHWSGLPGSDRLIETLLETDWSTLPVAATSPDAETVEKALDSAAQRVDAYYALPYYKHVPLGPESVVADVRADGSVHVWACSQKYRALQADIAAMLETDLANVVIHAADGAGSFGRTTSGSSGAESEAVLLSQACGRPVRLQWMREEDFTWSTQQAAYLGESSASLDENGRLVAVDVKHHAPGYSADSVQLGGLLAGLPCGNPPPHPSYQNMLFVEWRYDLVPHHLERGYGSPITIGAGGSPIAVGLRHRAMRSPGHLQQNFGVECLINEAAVAVGADPIQFRIDHTTSGRYIRVLERVRDVSGWQNRPSPGPDARASGTGIVKGRGVGAAVLHGGYFASIAEISLDLATGQVTVDKYWIAADAGFVVNPRLLKLNVEGASVMGISQALHEEVTFNHSAITNIDFRTYPILTMAETPEITVELIDGRETMAVGSAAEPPNMLPPVALAAAVFDATGKPIRRLPLRPTYVLAELRERSG